VLEPRSPLGVGLGRPTERGEMPTYVVLIDWNQQGLENFKDTVDRYEAARSQFGLTWVRRRVVGS
jgi:uncharacterized protein with GYD domain